MEAVEKVWPPKIGSDELRHAYGDVYLEHCTSCHEDLEYGFMEAVEPVVVKMPNGTLRTHWDACCLFIKSLKASGIPYREDYDLDGFVWKEE